jgi:hypothetical protein
MGNNVIVIRTVGCHNNGRHDDAEQLGMRFVDELRANGHNVLGAICATGGAEIDLDVHSPANSPSPKYNVPGKLKADGEAGQSASPGRCAYERYLHASGGRSLVSGAELPGFNALSPEIQAAWMAAADHSKPRLVR